MSQVWVVLNQWQSMIREKECPNHRNIIHISIARILNFQNEMKRGLKESDWVLQRVSSVFLLLRFHGNSHDFQAYHISTFLNFTPFQSSRLYFSGGAIILPQNNTADLPPSWQAGITRQLHRMCSRYKSLQFGDYESLVAIK